MNFTEFYLTENENQIYSSQFKNWFGDWENDFKNASKIVNKDKTPMIMYHGSYSNFNIFDKQKRGQSGTLAAKKAFWFTSSKDHATNFSGGSESLVRPFYINARKVIVFDAKDVPAWNTSMLHQIRNRIVQKAIREGKDGVIFKNMFDLGGGPNTTIVAVFEPNQIKSAVNNNGNFDINSDNVNENRSIDNILK